MSDQRLRTREHEALRLICIASRQEAKISQEELAKRLKRPRSYISRIETGEQQHTVISFKKWMVALGLDDIAYYARWSRWHKPVSSDR